MFAVPTVAAFEVPASECGAGFEDCGVGLEPVGGLRLPGSSAEWNGDDILGY